MKDLTHHAKIIDTFSRVFVSIYIENTKAGLDFLRATLALCIPAIEPDEREEFLDDIVHTFDVIGEEVYEDVEDLINRFNDYAE